MSRNALNAILPDALNNLGLGTVNTPVFYRLSLGGALYNGNNTLQSDSPVGQAAEASSTFSGDNTSGASGSAIRAYDRVYNNHPSSSKNAWNEYLETHVTKQATLGKTFGTESSLYSRAPAVAIDPYTPNPTGVAENYRIDCGIGTLNGNITASSAGTTLTVTAVNSGGIYSGQVVTGTGIAADTELLRQLTGNPQTGIGTWETTVSNTHASETMTLAMDPKGCSTPIHVINNGAAYLSGIVFDSTSITASGGLSPAMQLPASYSIDWYSAPGAKTWSLYSSSNSAATRTINLRNSSIDVSSPMAIKGDVASADQVAGTLNIGGNGVKPSMTANGQADIFIDSTTGGLSFISAGSTSDFQAFNASGTLVCSIPDNSTIWKCTNLTLTGLTTGTNADSLCLSAAGVVLIQAANCTISSMRFKNLDGHYADGLAAIGKLDPIVFTMKPGEQPNPDANYGRLQIGLSAENVASVEPRCAIYEPDGVTPKSYRQECIIAVLVAGMQEQQRQIAALSAR